MNSCRADLVSFMAVEIEESVGLQDEVLLLPAIQRSSALLLQPTLGSDFPEARGFALRAMTRGDRDSVVSGKTI